jgi:hypothetical protein
MDSHESVDIKEAAQYLQRSERSVRRYLQAGRLEHVKEPLSAGGFKYLISRQALELLKSELDSGKGRHAGIDMTSLGGLTAQVQGLQATVQVQAEQIGKLTEQLERQSIQFEQMIKLLPPAPGERQATWWRRLFRR